MKNEEKILFEEFKKLGLKEDEIRALITQWEKEKKGATHIVNDIYALNDFKIFHAFDTKLSAALTKSLDELLQNDNQRVKDGFPRRIRIGKLLKPTKDNNSKVIIVPTTTEPKFYHDNSITEDPDDLGETGGTGEEQEGDVLGEQQADPQQGEGEGQGAGEGGEEGHDITQKAFDLGKILTEQFELPNLQDKGNKRSLIKFQYDLTDKKKGFGQLLDKKATIKDVIKTNIHLGNLSETGELDTSNLLISPKDHVYRIMSKEKRYESQALVFFIRDYSGSMQGAPTELVSTQHLLIYSWLMFQYQNRVENRFILHDTQAKEVPDFYTYYSSNIAGGTKVAPAFQLVKKIITEEQLAKDYNIYIFYGTDGDDWDSTGKETIEILKDILPLVNRIGITIAKNAWSSSKQTTIEKYLDQSKLLIRESDKIKLDAFEAENAEEKRIIEGIKKLIS